MKKKVTLKEAKECKCQRCLEESCHHNADYCKVVAYLDQYLPKWFDRQINNAAAMSEYNILNAIQQNLTKWNIVRIGKK